MKEAINDKIDNLIDVLNNDSRMIKLEELKKKILGNGELLDKIDKLKKLDKYSVEYKLLKDELFNNSDFILFKELENEINYLILEINSKLRILTNERRCKNEGN